MTLKEHIEDIQNRLKEGGYITEMAISNQIVVRLLKELGWPIFDEWTVIFEYPVGNKKVDLVLCDPRAEPVIFIEMKAFERFLENYEVKKAKEQLSNYISHFQNNSCEEISIAILIDGQKWLFFYPMGEENWKEHPVRELDFIESDIEEITECLNRYLNYNSILTGEVIQTIRDDCRNVDRRPSKDKDSFSRRLRVTMPNGEVIDCIDPKDTFVEVIIKLGPENVACSSPKIVKKTPFDHGEFQKHNGYYINTYLPLKWEKRSVLVSIGRKLCVPLKVERIEKQEV